MLYFQYCIQLQADDCVKCVGLTAGCGGGAVSGICAWGMGAAMRGAGPP